MFNSSERWVYDTLMTVSSPYLNNENIFNYFLPNYFNLNNNSIVYNLLIFESVDTLDLTNVYDVKEVQINIQGRYTDEIDDIASNVIETFHGADDNYCRDIEIGVQTSFFNELLDIHQTTIIIYIKTNIIVKGSFSGAFSMAFDVTQNY